MGAGEVAKVEIRIHPTLPLGNDVGAGHNRWHPDIKPVARCRSGDVILMETRDAVDGQIGPQSTLEAVSQVDSSLGHPLTGPVYVEQARPGDLLEVEILDILPAGFGYTLQQRGFGFLRDLFPDPFLVKWRLQDGWATSADIPRLRVPAAPFMGTIGVAPDRRLLATAAERESAALARGEFLFPPSDSRGAVPGGMIASEGLRTGPPRENGGNLDVKEVAKGARVLFPVFVEGALLSAGDAHFAQGDGEVCGQGIEMRATFIARLLLHPGRAIREGITGTRIISAAATRPAGRCFITTGLSLADDGSNHSENATLAARRALLDMIDYLAGEGFTRQQAYAICSVAVDLRISELVDVPNVVVSAALPLEFIT
jgi:formamidase